MAVVSLKASNNLLPVGISNFEDLRLKGKIYVDKTAFIEKMTQSSGPIFISRHRRFGKSLLTSTIKSIYENGTKYFQDLEIAKTWCKSTFPVLYLNFAILPNDNVENFKERFNEKLVIFAKKLNLELSFTKDTTPDILIDKIFDNLENEGQDLSDSQKIVVLVDEYDNQLVSQLNNGTEYEKYRKLLSKFYEVIKNRFEHVEFMFITGVTRFSNVSIFSCFNNLKDITLNPKYAGLFGFTDEELDNYFEPFLEYAAKVLNKSLDLFKSELKNYYDGYCFDMFAKVHVFNPWSVLKFFDDCELGFQPYWTDSGFQSLIVEYFAAQAKIGENNYSFGHLINPRTLSQSQLKNNATIADLSLEAILFQSGYLTIQSADGDDFTIAPPNHELKKFLANLFFDHIVNCKIRDQIGNAFSTKSKQALRDKNTDSLKEIFNTILNSSSYSSNIFESEIAIVDAIAAVLMVKDFFVTKENPQAKGRPDLVLSLDSTRYIFEFKLNRQDEENTDKLLELASEQIISRDYGDVLPLKNLVRFAVVISQKERTVVSVKLVDEK